MDKTIMENMTRRARHALALAFDMDETDFNTYWDGEKVEIVFSGDTFRVEITMEFARNE